MQIQVTDRKRCSCSGRSYVSFLSVSISKKEPMDKIEKEHASPNQKKNTQEISSHEVSHAVMKAVKI